MLGLAAVPAVIQFIGFIFMPESPRYLIENGRYEDGKKVLRKILRTEREVEEEFLTIVKKHEENETEKIRKGNI